MANLGYTSAGFYRTPNLNGTPSVNLYKIPSCNYAPVEACTLKKGLWSDVIIETSPYEDCVWNINKFMCQFNSLVSSTQVTAAGLTPANLGLTATQINSIIENFLSVSF